MFLRPFHVRSHAAAKGTERKRLRRSAATFYPQVESSRLDQVLPNKSTLENLRVTTHSGSYVTISMVNEEPIYFEYEDDLFPTVYVLWQLPDLLRPVSTWPLVITKLKGGADLMLPGVVRQDQGGEPIEGIQKGQKCAITVVGSRVAVGVSVSLMSSEEMLANQLRGKGFKIIHLFGDKLWELGSKADPPHTVQCTSSADEIDVTGGIKEGVRQSAVGTQYSHQSVDEEAVTLPNEEEVGVLDKKSSLNKEGGEGAESMGEVGKLMDDVCLSGALFGDMGEEKIEEEQEQTEARGQSVPETGRIETAEDTTPQNPIKAMDDLLEECFFQAIKTRMRKVGIPLLTDTFYTSHMLKLCPASLKLDVKKSSYKKLSRFLRSMCELGVVKVEETGKGVESITDVNFNHDLVTRFSPSLLPTNTGHSASALAQGGSSKKKCFQVTELYMPSHKLMPVFSRCGHHKSSLLKAAEVKEVITSYVKHNKLVSESDARVVVLDPVLCDALYVKGQPPLEQLKWAELMNRIIESMKPAFSVSDGASKTFIRKGNLQPIQMTLVQRTGNKKVTLVDNLDLYGISAEEIAHTMRKIAAASTTVTSAPDKKGQQVLVQGNAAKTIAKLLQDEYGIPMRLIEAVDKTKPTKKKK